jgi:hypothetical protein
MRARRSDADNNDLRLDLRITRAAHPAIVNAIASIRSGQARKARLLALAQLGLAVEALTSQGGRPGISAPLPVTTRNHQRFTAEELLESFGESCTEAH